MRQEKAAIEGSFASAIDVVLFTFGRLECSNFTIP